ncbi:hypothetical protein Gohar_006796 [Gossypium harknessii]|uniref:Uncharacterized protein n=1 Tax=Gossypium harknessii TaxID=34285 RepID=A0A7J9GEJ4_9ROSI|nr:hypothetical protein [Gossypium harknessii]
MSLPGKVRERPDSSEASVSPLAMINTMRFLKEAQPLSLHLHPSSAVSSGPRVLPPLPSLRKNLNFNRSNIS